MTALNGSADAGVRIAGLCKEFRTGNGHGVLRALEDVSFSIAPGELVAVTGKSGCGKTTILRIVAGLERPTDGTVRIDGRVVDKPGQDRGMVFQRAELLPWRSALRNVTYGLEIQGLPAAERRRRAEQYLDLVGLGAHGDLRPMQLSGGMQQRVGIARALAIEPEVLLMDEPFGALDAQTRESLQESLLEIHARTRKTIMFVTHDLDEAVLLADRIVVMSKGPGTVQEVISVDIPRPRTDVGAIKASDAFIEARTHLWRLLKGS